MEPSPKAPFHQWGCCDFEPPGKGVLAAPEEDPPIK